MMKDAVVVVVAAMALVGLVVGSPVRGKTEPVTTVASVVLKGGSGFEVKMGEMQRVLDVHFSQFILCMRFPNIRKWRV